MFPRGTPSPDSLSRSGGLSTGVHGHSMQGGTKGPIRPDRDRPRSSVSASVRHFLPSAIDQQTHQEQRETWEVQRG